MFALLEVKDLVKHYGEVKAVKGVSFSVEKGKCFGLLGPNGAGKTTTIEVIENVDSPTSGSVLYKGSSRNASFKEEVGIQFQQTSLLGFLTVRETLETFQSLFSRFASVDELAELCHLKEFLDQMNDKISGGQKQRFLLALALVNEPDLLFLDEPSTGLDPQARRNLWDVVSRIKEAGKTIILTTHYMEEAEELCDEIAIMDYGRIIAQGTPVELIREHGGEVVVTLPRKNFLNGVDCGEYVCKIHEERVDIFTDDANGCLENLLRRNVVLSDMVIRPPNLESVFLNLTGRKLRE